MGTNSGWVVGWVDLAALAGTAGKPRRIRSRNSFPASLTSCSTHRQPASLPLIQVRGFEKSAQGVSWYFNRILAWGGFYGPEAHWLLMKG